MRIKMKRDFDKNPYTPDEARVAAFFSDRGVGGGDDPIGFLLASYEYIVEQRNTLELLLHKERDQ